MNFFHASETGVSEIEIEQCYAFPSREFEYGNQGGSRNSWISQCILFLEDVQEELRDFSVKSKV